MPTGQILDKILICYSDLDAYLDFICSEPTHTLSLFALMLLYSHTHLHTVVADAAVRAARRPVEVTGGAPLHPDLNALDLHVLVEWCPEIILLILVLVRCGWEEDIANKPRKRHVVVLYDSIWQGHEGSASNEAHPAVRCLQRANPWPIRCALSWSTVWLV